MPTYVYRCSECHVQYELVQQIADDPDKVCQDCGEETAKRILQSPALTADAAPSTKNNVPPRRADPAWERGLAGTTRRDGSFVPYRGADGNTIGVKQFADNRTKYERIIREQKNLST